MVNYVTLALIFVTVVSPACVQQDYGHKLVANILERHLHSVTKNANVSFPEGSHQTTSQFGPIKLSQERAGVIRSYQQNIRINDNKTLGSVTRNRIGDVLEALGIRYMRVAERSLTNRQHQKALAFFIHLSDEIHQPLYLNRRKDRDGNNLDVKSIDHRNNFNLHQV